MDSRRERIEKAGLEDICPECGCPLDATARVGTGSVRDGVFCSLGCLASFHADYFRDRIRWGIPNQN